MRLSVIFTISFFIVSLILGIGVGFYNYNNLNEVLTERVCCHLETTAESRADHIKTFLEEEKQKVIILSTDVVFEELLMVDKNNPEYGERYERLQKQVNSIVEIDEGIHELFVLDKKGEIVLANNKENVGLDKLHDLYFINGKEKVYIKDAYYSETIRKKIITISSPILDDETNEFLGMVVMGMGLTELDKITVDRTGLGETGEVYLVNRENYLITPSRFFENSVMVQEVDTENTRDCIEHYERFYNPETKEVKKHENKIELFLDYRGVNVFGAHSYVPEMQWCVLVEMDESEALGIPMNNLLKTFLIFTIAASVLLSLIGFFVGKWMDRRFLPINKKDRR